MRINFNRAFRRLGSFGLHSLLFLAGVVNSLIPDGAMSERSTLLVVRTDGLGDLVLFFPVIQQLRKKFHDRRIVLVVRQQFAELARACAGVDDVISLPWSGYRSNPVTALKTLAEVRRTLPWMAVNGGYSRTIVSEEIMLWSGARLRVGWDGEWKDSLRFLRRIYNLNYSRLLRTQFGPSVHELERHRVLLNSLGIDLGRLVPGLASSNTDSRKDPRISLNHDCSTRTAAFVVGADNPIRIWPFGKYIEVAAFLLNETPELTVVFLGDGKSGQGAIPELPNIARERILDLRGKTTLLELLEIVKRSSVVVGNETGPMHLGIAADVPTVTLVGGGHYGRFMPYGDPAKHIVVTNPLDCFNCDWRCERERPECVLGIDSQQVVRAARVALSTSRQ
jgi:ADP-heptose:LPS heptosyltransferase